MLQKFTYLLRWTCDYGALTPHYYGSLHQFGMLEKKGDHLTLCSEVLSFEPKFFKVFILSDEIRRGVR